MLQPGPRQEPLGSPPPEPAARPQAAPGDQQPTRFLLIRQKPGALPWLVRALMRYMAPVQVVPVIGMGNALWRLGHERFEEAVEDRLVHVDAFNGATALTGIVEGAVCQRRGGFGDIDIGCGVGWVLTAEL